MTLTSPEFLQKLESLHLLARRVLGRSLILLTLATLSSATCQAGGSIGWMEVLVKITNDDPDLAALVQRQYDIADIGLGVRVGHDKDGNSLAPPFEVGERIPPYDFDAKPKGEAGDFTLRLSFEPTSIVVGKVNRWQLKLIVIAKSPSK